MNAFNASVFGAGSGRKTIVQAYPLPGLLIFAPIPKSTEIQ